MYWRFLKESPIPHIFQLANSFTVANYIGKGLWEEETKLIFTERNKSEWAASREVSKSIKKAKFELAWYNLTTNMLNED